MTTKMGNASEIRLRNMQIVSLIKSGQRPIDVAEQFELPVYDVYKLARNYLTEADQENYREVRNAYVFAKQQMSKNSDPSLTRSCTEMLSSGGEVNEIAHQFGVRLATVRQFRNKEIARLIQTGAPISEIADRFKVSEKRCYGLAARYLTTSERAKVRTITKDMRDTEAGPLRNKEIARLIRIGQPISEIARKFDLSEKRCYGLAARYLAALERKSFFSENRLLNTVEERVPSNEASSMWQPRIAEVKMGKKLTFSRDSVQTNIRYMHIQKEIEQGKTLNEIGKNIGLSRERVRQILKENGINVRQLRNSKKHKIDKEVDDNIVLVRDWIQHHPGCTSEEIAEKFHDFETAVMALVPADVRHLIMGRNRKKVIGTTARFSDAAILEVLKTASDIMNPMSGMYALTELRPLTRSAYDKMVRKGQVIGPSSSRIMQIFDTWSAACDLAEIPSVDAVRDTYERKWSEKELIEYVAAFLLATKLVGPGAFDDWSRLDPVRPSSSTLRNQVGQWSDCKEKALRHLRQKWS